MSLYHCNYVIISVKLLGKKSFFVLVTATVARGCSYL